LYYITIVLYNCKYKLLFLLITNALYQSKLDSSC